MGKKTFKCPNCRQYYSLSCFKYGEICQDCVDQLEFILYGRFEEPFFSDSEVDSEKNDKNKKKGRVI